MLLTVTTNIERYNAALVRYAEASRKTLDEVLDKKGRDLGIRLFTGFRARQWGGDPKVDGSALAFAQLKERTQAGRGTNVRPSLLAAFSEQRSALVGAHVSLADRLSQRAGKRVGSLLRQITANQEKRRHLWREIVGKEIKARARGIGVLAASFLWFRRKFTRGGIEFVRNKSGRTMGYAERDATTLHIVGITPGLDLVDARYGIVNTALLEALADTEVYTARKYREAFDRAQAAS